MKVHKWAWLLLSLVVVVSGLWIVLHEWSERQRDSALRSRSEMLLNDTASAVGEKGVNNLKTRIARDVKLRKMFFHQDLGASFSVYSSSWRNSHGKELYDTRTTIHSLFAASPLARAGLHPNDDVLFIDGKRPCLEIATEETMLELRSQCEKEISELLERAKDTFTIRVARWGEIHEFLVKKSDVGDDLSRFEAFIAANMSEWVKQIEANREQYLALNDEFEHTLPGASREEVRAYHVRLSHFYDVAWKPWHELIEKGTELMWYSNESRFFPDGK